MKRIRNLLARLTPQAPGGHVYPLRDVLCDIRRATPDNPCLAGFKVYSQNDEDGIIREIFRRIGDGDRRFFEIGCGNGLENNTHYLAIKGWTGTWVDGSEENIRSIELPRSRRLEIIQVLVDRDNINELCTEDVDFFSLDIDGNDVHVLAALKARPRVICVEYNYLFPPPDVVVIPYNPQHRYGSDNYYGGSLQAYVQTLPDYRLVCCNAAGLNAFFVRRDHAHEFVEYTPEQLYQPFRRFLVPFPEGHKPSFKFLRDALNR